MSAPLLRPVRYRKANGAVEVTARPLRLTFALVQRAARQALGPTARLWRTPEGFAVGYEANPGRKVIATAATLDELVSR